LIQHHVEIKNRVCVKKTKKIFIYFYIILDEADKDKPADGGTQKQGYNQKDMKASMKFQKPDSEPKGDTEEKVDKL